MGLIAKDPYLQGNTDVPIVREQFVCPTWVFLLFEKRCRSKVTENVQSWENGRGSTVPSRPCACSVQFVSAEPPGRPPTPCVLSWTPLPLISLLVHFQRPQPGELMCLCRNSQLSLGELFRRLSAYSSCDELLLVL